MSISELLNAQEFQVRDTVEFTGDCTPNYDVGTGKTGVVIAADRAAKKYIVLYQQRHQMEIDTLKVEVHPSVLRLLYRPADYTHEATPVSAIIDLLNRNVQRLEANPYADITIKLQAGKPVLLEILTKHKPTV